MDLGEVLGEVGEVVDEEVIGEALETLRQRREREPDRVGVPVDPGQPEVDQPAQRTDRLRPPRGAAALFRVQGAASSPTLYLPRPGRAEVMPIWRRA